MTTTTDVDPLVRLRNQVACFKADVDRARLRLEALTATSNPSTRSAEHDFERAEAGLRNAERILRVAEGEAQ